MTRGVPQCALSSPVIFNMYINYLVWRAVTTSEAKRCDGAAVVVAGDVLLQGRTHHILQNLLNIPDEWKQERDARWSTGKMPYACRAEKEGDVIMSGTRLKKSHMVTYLGMTLQAEGLTMGRSNTRAKKAGREARALACIRWWKLDIHPGHVG